MTYLQTKMWQNSHSQLERSKKVTLKTNFLTCEQEQWESLVVFTKNDKVMANPVSLIDVKFFSYRSSVDRERVYGSTNLSSTRRQTVAEITHLFICFISVLFQVNSRSVGTQLSFRGILHSLADGGSTGSESVTKRRFSSSSECLWQA